MEERYVALVPVIVLGMEEGDPSRMRQHDVAADIKYFLRCMSALGEWNVVDYTWRDLTASAHLQRTVSSVNVSGGKAKHLAAMFVLYLQM